MADTSAQPSPSEQDSLFGFSRRTSAQGDATITADAPQKHFEDVGSMIVPSEDMDHEPNEIELQRNTDRFEVELEFIQCLASPNYLHELAIQGYLEDPAFLNFLEYLEYWRQPEFAQHIVYPTCLKHLSLLKQPMFRLYLKDVGTVDELHNQEIWHWATWREGENTRLKREQRTRDEMERQHIEAERAQAEGDAGDVQREG
ncbi:hypothetical protein NliqN6_2850 [Naganishia liquefaciens]|uniref:Mediator of RNA polymerase II transcription subunit 31 n=1 Tax=Naganishia liquefaciens TaxID=104408 RepID=A0A8H3TT74_9TREE|nr:hypothetical protein NliqN6_2850 [Naganishia liquefaciens]